MKRLLIVLLFLSIACNRGEASKGVSPAQANDPAGNAERGKMLVGQYGCNVCHAVPGIDGPQGSLGPSLQGIASRPAISGGKVPNDPANLARFIQNPQSLNPQSTMMPMNMTPADAQDITAYLLTLR
jgi:cytochrome c2